VREWPLTLPKELPPWELGFRWTPEFSKIYCKGQNLMDWGNLHAIGKILERRCLKWACMTHLDTSNTSYSKKKGSRVKLAIWLPTIKSQELPNFLAFRWRETYHWKALDEGYKLAFDLISIGGLHAKLWAPKVEGILVVGISRLPLGSLGTKSHLVLVPWLRTEYTIWGKVVASLESGPWWVLSVQVGRSPS